MISMGIKITGTAKNKRQTKPGVGKTKQKE